MEQCDFVITCGHVTNEFSTRQPVRYETKCRNAGYILTYTALS